MDINARVDQVISLARDDKKAITMILSACSDWGSADGCYVSVKAFDRAADHIILYFKQKALLEVRDGT